MQSMVAQQSLGGLNLHSGGLSASLLDGGASGLAGHSALGYTSHGDGGANGISVDEFILG